jgi:DNA-directed RNA polymerase specialized sigma24 family protein
VETTRASESDGEAEIGEQVAGHQADDVLWRHVQQLPERCQTLLRVIAFAAKPDYAQIARALGMPVGSIGPTRGRALVELRGQMKRGGYGPEDLVA